MIDPQIGYCPTHAAALLGLSTKTLYRAMASGQLNFIPCAKKAKRMILGKDLIKFSTR